MNNKVDYVITCSNCGQSSRLGILNETKIMWVDQTPIISARLRGDGQWGYECLCGNDTRIAYLEKDNANALVQGSSQTIIDQLVENIAVDDSKQFITETA